MSPVSADALARIDRVRAYATRVGAPAIARFCDVAAAGSADALVELIDVEGMIVDADPLAFALVEAPPCLLEAAS